jgi:uncharacterized protein (DUF2062 family)
VVIYFVIAAYFFPAFLSGIVLCLLRPGGASMIEYALATLAVVTIVNCIVLFVIWGSPYIAGALIVFVVGAPIHGFALVAACRSTDFFIRNYIRPPVNSVSGFEN